MTTPRDSDQIESLVPHDVRYSIGHADDYEILVRAVAILESWLNDDAKVERVRTGNGQDLRYRMTKTVRGRMRLATTIMSDMASIMKFDAQRRVASIQRIDGDRDSHTD